MKKYIAAAAISLHIVTCVLLFLKLQFGLYEVTAVSTTLLIVVLAMSIFGIFQLWKFILKGERA